VIPKKRAINPSSLDGGDISILKNASEMMTIRMMPNARRVSMGRRERDSFIKNLESTTPVVEIAKSGDFAILYGSNL
jgi:hypothetical protein